MEEQLAMCMSAGSFDAIQDELEASGHTPNPTPCKPKPKHHARRRS